MGPNFLCVGMQKAGTRWLYDQLHQADGAWMPPIKEINYFSKKSFKVGNLEELKSLRRRLFSFASRHRSLDRKFYTSFERGLVPENYNDEWYFSLYGNKGKYVSGDISPGYSALGDEQVLRISEKLPGVLVLLLLRHPVDRIKSAISMSIRNGRILEDDVKSLDGVKKFVSRSSVARSSYPSEIWRRWMESFGSDRCKFFFMEDISSNPEWVRSQISHFIGLKNRKFRLPADFNRKSKNKKYYFSDEVEAYLYDLFYDEVMRCREVFQGHALDWRSHF